MLIDGTLVTVPLLVWLFLRMQAEAEARQPLLERGIDPRRARRVVRYGSGGGRRSLSDHGLPIRDPPALFAGS